MTSERPAPRWTIPFLRALERTGDVRASAEDAGIDHTTAYLRRRTHADFAEGWERALKAHEEWVKHERQEELEALARVPSTIASPSNGPPPRSGEELTASAGQVKRVGAGRWNRAKEKLFFDELAASANVKRSAKAAGVSPNAVFARRLKDPLFRAKWQAVLQMARASIDMYLVEASNRTFDPDEIDSGEVTPKVSVAEAIRIAQLNASKKQDEEQLPDPYAEEAARMTADDVQALREKILLKLKRMRERDMPEWIDAGWSFDEEADHMVPPGWVRAEG